MAAYLTRRGYLLLLKWPTDEGLRELNTKGPPVSRLVADGYLEQQGPTRFWRRRPGTHRYTVADYAVTAAGRAALYEVRTTGAHSRKLEEVTPDKRMQKGELQKLRLLACVVREFVKVSGPFPEGTPAHAQLAQVLLALRSLEKAAK